MIHWPVDENAGNMVLARVVNILVAVDAYCMDLLDELLEMREAVVEAACKSSDTGDGGSWDRQHSEDGSHHGQRGSDEEKREGGCAWDARVRS